MHYLAEDAQELAKLRSILRGQAGAAKSFLEKYCRTCGEIGNSNFMQSAINQFTDNVDEKISHLDQTVKDLLQFVRTIFVLR
jgi:hypothetical protein